MSKKVEYEGQELGLKLLAENGNGALNLSFLTRGRIRVWTSGGETVVLPPEELRVLLSELIKRFPLDALGQV